MRFLEIWGGLDEAVGWEPSLRRAPPPRWRAGKIECEVIAEVVLGSTAVISWIGDRGNVQPEQASGA
jgi:hypothetical protein